MKIDKATAQRAFTFYVSHKKTNWAGVSRELGLKINSRVLFNAVRGYGFLDVPTNYIRCQNCKIAKHCREFSFISESSDAQVMCYPCLDELGSINRKSMSATRGVSWNEPLNKLWLDRWDELQGASSYPLLS